MPIQQRRSASFRQSPDDAQTRQIRITFTPTSAALPKESSRRTSLLRPNTIWMFFKMLRLVSESGPVKRFTLNFSSHDIQWWTAPGRRYESSEQFEYPDQPAQRDLLIAPDRADVLTAAAQSVPSHCPNRLALSATGLDASDIRLDQHQLVEGNVVRGRQRDLVNSRGHGRNSMMGAG